MAQRFRILAADKLASEGLAFLEEQPDVELVNRPGLSEEELAGIVGEHDGMIVRSGVDVTAKVLEHPGRLKVVARAGVGVDNIDLDAATAHGILVMNSAEASTTSTAEHAFTLMLALARHIGPAYRTMAEGGWDRGKFVGAQMAGRTLGVVGFGRIGQTLARRALAMEMDVIAYDPFINADTMLDGDVKMYRDFVDMLPHANVLSFHVPLTEQTRGMLGEATFPRCPKGVLVVNASRGGVVDEQALLKAIESGQCGGAALDVFTEEPPPADSPLRGHPLILTTPHLGASTQEAQKAVSIVAAEQLLAYLRNEGIRGAVNVRGLRVDLDPVQRAFADLADRMARIICPMITRGIAEITVELTGKGLASAAETIERAALVRILGHHLTDPVNLINVKQVAESRGIGLKLTVREDDSRGGPSLKIEIEGPASAVDSQTPGTDRTRRIVGRIFDDLRPRVTEINHYYMDMIPDGDMVFILNEDRPGMIGMVGQMFGGGNVNIADMAISRREHTAMMVLKVDGQAPDELLDALTAKPGILKAQHVRLPEERVG